MSKSNMKVFAILHWYFYFNKFNIHETGIEKKDYLMYYKISLFFIREIR